MHEAISELSELVSRGVTVHVFIPNTVSPDVQSLFDRIDYRSATTKETFTKNALEWFRHVADVMPTCYPVNRSMQH